MEREVITPFLSHAKSQMWGHEVQHEDFAVLMATLSGETVKRARYDTERLPLIVFADNFWLLGTSLTQLKSMTLYWHSLLKKAGLSVDISESCWSTTATMGPPLTTPTLNGP